MLVGDEAGDYDDGDTVVIGRSIESKLITIGLAEENEHN